MFKLLRERIRQGLSVRHVQKTGHGWQLTQAHRLSGVIQWDAETEGALPLLIVDGRVFTWDQIGRMMMTFEGFTLNAIVEDTIEVIGGPLADGRLGSQASSQPAPAVPAPVVRPGASNRKAAKRRGPTLGEAVVVEKIDLSGADELIAICRRRGKRQKVRLLDLELPVPRPKGAEWVAAYHRWSRRR